MKMPVIAIEILLGFGVPIGWGLWELWTLRREKERDRLKAAHEAALKTGAASETATTSEPRPR